MTGTLTTTQNNSVLTDWTPYIYWPTYTQHEPTVCVGKAHVFECDHVKKCKCGAITRVMPKAKEK